MVKLNLVPKDGNWNLEQAKAYFLQQIAESLEKILQESKREERTYDLLIKERVEAEIDRSALSLMIYKEEIKGIFIGKDSIRLSEFRNILIFKRERYLEYMSRDSLIRAIAKTDYLDYIQVGTGYRVKLIGES